MHTIVTGLGFGDEGKGGIVDFIARSPAYGRPRLGVRFSGGLQAGHNVVAGNVHHTFSQYAACLLVPGTTSILTRHVFVDPFAMQNEAEHLRPKIPDDLASRAFVSSSCPLVTPFHRTLNRVREAARGGLRHGSCGVGIGEAFRDRDTGLGMLLRDLNAPDLVERLEAQRLAHLAEAERLALKCSPGAEQDLDEYLKDLRNPEAPFYIASRYAMFNQAPPVQVVEDSRILDMISKESAVFEGAQGLLLDMDHGFFPHVTPAHTDARNALDILKEAGGTARVVGVLRSYLTRHGEGPFPSECQFSFPEPHNTSDSFQGRFRHGAFDVPLLAYAAEKSIQLDELALTHIDAFPKKWPVCLSYKGSPAIQPDAASLGNVHAEVEELDAECMAECVQEWSGRPVSIVSRGPAASEKRMLPACGPD